MEEQKKKINIFKRIALLLSTVGPGLFLIGYNIGTGSVTTMASAGSRYGMQLFWALLLSCIFTFVMLIAYGKYTLVTGETPMHSFKKHFRYGKAIALFIMVALIIGEVAALIGVLGIVSSLIKEWTKPLTSNPGGFSQLYITIIIIIGLYYLLWNGKYSLFEKFMIIFVILIGGTFSLSMILVVPEPMVVIKGLLPGLPSKLPGYQSPADRCTGLRLGLSHY